MNPAPTRIDGTVPAADQKGELVRDMFTRIAPTYVKTNALLTFGIDAWWRRQAIATLGPGSKGEVLDLCAGTLDLTLVLLDQGATRVDAIDFSEGMLEQGRPRLPAGAPVTARWGDAQALPCDDGTFDAAICGFGMRNVADNGLALREVHRVLRPAARFAVLEFFRPTAWYERVFHGVFNKLVLPTVGGLLSGDRAAYSYLANSMEAYMVRSEFETLAADNGFRVVSAKQLLPPVASLVVLERL
jgi:demethylmenaquinone methyltransferase / 2-methoxy-6-polyprenyl-1,4-benzoquinol methylase